MLSAEKVTTYKARLEKERERLLKEIEAHGKVIRFGKESWDEAEKEDEAEELAGELAIAQAMRMQVVEIEAALERIHRGVYGLCVSCRTELPEDTLHLVPEAPLCQTCHLKEN